MHNFVWKQMDKHVACLNNPPKSMPTIEFGGVGEHILDVDCMCGLR